MHTSLVPLGEECEDIWFLGLWMFSFPRAISGNTILTPLPCLCLVKIPFDCFYRSSLLLNLYVLPPPTIFVLKQVFYTGYPALCFFSNMVLTIPGLSPSVWVIFCCFKQHLLEFFLGSSWIKLGTTDIVIILCLCSCECGGIAEFL